MVSHAIALPPQSPHLPASATRSESFPPESGRLSWPVLPAAQCPALPPVAQFPDTLAAATPPDVSGIRRDPLECSPGTFSPACPANGRSNPLGPLLRSAFPVPSAPPPSRIPPVSVAPRATGPSTAPFALQSAIAATQFPYPKTAAGFSLPSSAIAATARPHSA